MESTVFPGATHRRLHIRKTLLWIAVGFVVIAAILVFALSVVDWNAMRGPVGRLASARLGLPVDIGQLDVHLWSLTPEVQLDRLVVGNASRDQPGELARIGHFEMEVELPALLKGDLILSRVLIEKLDLHLHRDAANHANWRTGTGKAHSGDAPDLPLIRNFIIESGKVQVVDDVRKLTFTGKVRAHERADRNDHGAFRIEGEGVLNGRAFAAKVSGGPLINLDPDTPYPFVMTMRAGDIAIDADGELLEPFDLGKVHASVHASGDDLADLYYLTGLALPNTPPYRLSAAIQRKGSEAHVTDIDGTLGPSDLHGAIDIELSGKRPKVSGKLESRVLEADSVVAAMGPHRQDSDTLFPDAALQVERLRAMDADVLYAADAMSIGPVSMKEISAHVVLDEGVVRVDPLSLALPQGRLSGSVTIDARQDVAHSKADLLLEGADLGHLRDASDDPAAPLAGPVRARARLEGDGVSMHEFASHASGAVTVVVPHGEIRASLAELTGIDVVRALGLLLANDDERMTLRCGVAHFQVGDGVMHADQIVFDASSIVIKGEGEVNLGSEELHLSVHGEPKEPRIGRVRSPIEIKGTLREPVIGIAPGKAAGQAGIAAALAIVATPLAAILAFVDPGLAEDADCAALLADAQSDASDEPRQKGAGL